MRNSTSHQTNPPPPLPPNHSARSRPSTANQPKSHTTNSLDHWSTNKTSVNDHTNNINDSRPVSRLSARSSLANSPVTNVRPELSRSQSLTKQQAKLINSIRPKTSISHSHARSGSSSAALTLNSGISEFDRSNHVSLTSLKRDCSQYSNIANLIQLQREREKNNEQINNSSSPSSCHSQLESLSSSPALSPRSFQSSTFYPVPPPTAPTGQQRSNMFAAVDEFDLQSSPAYIPIVIGNFFSDSSSWPNTSGISHSGQRPVEEESKSWFDDAEPDNESESNYSHVNLSEEGRSRPNSSRKHFRRALV